MAVGGQQAVIINQSGQHDDVRAFSNEFFALEEVPIVDAAVAYSYPYSLKTYLLIVTNALLVPTMQDNLIPSFIIREMGLVVNNVPRIHCGKDVIYESHLIVSGDPELMIPLRI